MSIRWRATGELLCAAMHPELPDDTYFNDGVSYRFTVVEKLIIADVNHEVNGLWHWNITIDY